MRKAMRIILIPTPLDNLISGITKVPGAPPQNYFCAPTNKNWRVWSEK